MELVRKYDIPSVKAPSHLLALLVSLLVHLGLHDLRGVVGHVEVVDLPLGEGRAEGEDGWGLGGDAALAEGVVEGLGSALGVVELVLAGLLALALPRLLAGLPGLLLHELLSLGLLLGLLRPLLVLLLEVHGIVVERAALHGELDGHVLGLRVGG